ncbi:MAG TPA: PAS domain-containing protein [Pseudolabrys sp.]|nr:PAS domain-containing protein [Pseudolabrys sp.]
MQHPSTRALYAYWNERRGNRAAPDREDIDPVAIRQVLGDTFMLAADFVDEPRFRLAGTRVCALFCRELKGESFAALWSKAEHARIDRLLRNLTGRSIGTVASLSGHACDGARLDLEMLLLPLAHNGHGRIRALGALSPVATPYWIGESALGELEIRELREIGPEGRIGSPVQLDSASGERGARHGFVVHQGGRDTRHP